jgi:hypothetical protein
MHIIIGLVLLSVLVAFGSIIIQLALGIVMMVCSAVYVGIAAIANAFKSKA